MINIMEIKNMQRNVVRLIPRRNKTKTNIINRVHIVIKKVVNKKKKTIRIHNNLIRKVNNLISV